MKKTTSLLLLTLFSLSTEAQSFPDPYCTITEYYGVEEITSVAFGNDEITNTNTTDALLDHITTVVNVQSEQIYTLRVQGNTYADYNNEYVAFIDWNHNNSLDDEGEVYYIGLIFDSTGNDEKSVSLDITVPTTAVAGNTRIRIIKVYTDSEAGILLATDPCNILVKYLDYDGIDPAYGQALDFTLNVAALGVNSFDKTALRIYPNPSKEVLNVNYKTVIKEVKIYNTLGQEVLSSTVDKANFQLNVGHFSPGTYVVKLTAEEGQYRFKLLKD